MIIVTGGAGFIGSNLVAALNQRGIDDILVVDQLGSDTKWTNLIELKFADYVESDDFIEMAIEGELDDSVQAVFHLGACTDTTETDTAYLLKNNYEYTKLLANWAVENNIRFIYASSAATYGDGSKGFSDDEENIAELSPLNMYGYSKQLFDLWAKRSGLLNKIAGLKYFNVFGPNEHHKADMRSFILKAYEQITADSKVRLFKSHNPDYADGEYKRDFVYVKDAVDMTLFFMDNPDVNGIFNVGTGKARTWNDMVKAVFTAMDKKPKIEFVPMPDNLKNQYQYFTQAEMEKLTNAGYNKPTTPLENAIKDYVCNYLK
ncbi:MAG: ADP-glyceromanno-heptose 6-epimerase [Sedimentisphaerales bacterium]|nr:ADP-glyceromanno-heptose 6-epimerase [Sedimentisphaerales bacterium]